MAVVSSTAPGGGPGPAFTGRAPIRTCVGCRNRAAAAELLRVVVAPDSAGPPGDRSEVGTPIVPDPRRRMAGRGAWVHLDQQCVEFAVRRRAFARALRVPGAVDPAAVSAYVYQHQLQYGAPSDPAGTPPAEPRRR